jgi:hypothetical protein
MSARFDSQSMILPLPSSPHWAPITVTLDMAGFPYPVTVQNPPKHGHGGRLYQVYGGA